jgi:two-component system NarL family sensor kinase
MKKNCLYKKCISLFPVFFCVFAFAQTKIIDSLKKEISVLKNDNIKTGAVFLLCEQYRSLHPDTLYSYFKMAEALAAKSNDPNIRIRPAFYKAVYLINKVQLDSAEKVINQSLDALAHTSDNTDLKNNFILLKSRLLIKNNKQKESIENSLLVLQSSELTKDTLWQLKAKTFIGWGYMELSQDQQALNWFLEAVSLDKASNGKYAQPALYGNITSVYVNLLKNDSAELWAEKSVNLSMAKGDLTGLANAYFINAGIYIEMHNNARAEKLMEEGIKIRKLIGDPFYIVSDIYQLSNFYAHNHEPEKGISIAKEGIPIAEKYNLHAKLYILYTALGENYQSAGDYKMYSETLNKIITLKDSTYTKNSAEALSDIQTKYEVQKKENIIISQQLDLTKKNYLVYGTFILLATSVLISYVVFRARKKNQLVKIREIGIEQKKRTMDAVMQAEENERKRIAAELHDSVAQKMVVAKLNLEAFEGYLPKLSNEEQKVFDNIFSLVDESCTEVRNLSHSMMPHAFFQSGLADAVKNFIDKIQNKNLRILFNTDGDLENLDKNTELMIYRIIQECLQNIIKHAHADRVDISVIAENGEIDATIEDNGIGFDTSLLENNSGMGMKNIRSRVEFLNGQLDINSHPGGGCVVAFYIPVKK